MGDDNRDVDVYQRLTALETSTTSLQSTLKSHSDKIDELLLWKVVTRFLERDIEQSKADLKELRKEMNQMGERLTKEINQTGQRLDKERQEAESRLNTKIDGLLNNKIVELEKVSYFARKIGAWGFGLAATIVAGILIPILVALERAIAHLILK